MKNNTLRVLVAGILTVLVIGALAYLAQSKAPHADIAAEQVGYPALSLPLAYFNADSVVGGDASPAYQNEISKGNYDAKPDYTSAIIDTGDDMQTYPTISVSFKDFSTSTVSLPPVRTKAVILKEIADTDGNDSRFIDTANENIAKYGSLATRYLPDQFIGGVSTIYATGGGSKETVVILCSTGSADGFCGEAQVISGGRVIFDTQSDYVDITPSDIDNGFYVHWENDQMEPSRANPLGYMKTRFVYEHGAFRPVYEQRVYYLNLKNASSP